MKLLRRNSKTYCPIRKNTLKIESIVADVKISKMKAQLKNNNGNKHQQDRKIIQLTELIQLNDQEAELLVGGWRSGRGVGTAPYRK